MSLDSGNLAPPISPPSRFHRLLERIDIPAVRLLANGSSQAPVTSADLFYWLSVIVLMTVSCVFGHRIAAPFARYRWQIDQAIRRLSPYSQDPIFTVLVIIGDDEYWGEDLARRTPLKRDYLAHLVEGVAALNPAVIALDVKLRSPDKAGATRSTSKEGITLPVEAAYVDETVALLQAVKKVTQRPDGPTVILARSMLANEGVFERLANVHDGFDFGDAKVRFGFLNLDEEDCRVVTPTLTLSDDSTLDSFSNAAVRGFAPQRSESLLANVDYFVGLVDADNFTTIGAGQILNAVGHDDAQLLAELARKCAHKIVIIGAEYHKDMRGGGEYEDNHPTPLQDFRGAFLHGNYIEGILAGRALPLRKFVVMLVEILLSLTLAWVLKAHCLKGWRRIVWVSAIVMAPFVLSYFALFNFGLYLDLSMVVLLLLHLYFHRGHLTEAHTSPSAAS